MGLKDRYNQHNQPTVEKQPTVSFDDEDKETTIGVSKTARAGMSYLRDRLRQENYSDTILFLVEHFKHIDGRGKHE